MLNESVLQCILSRLLRVYPAGHFGEGDLREYLSSVIAERARWHYLCSSTGSVGFSGTIVHVLTANAVLNEVEKMIEDMVSALTGRNVAPSEALGIELDLDAWRQSWRKNVNETF
jgi:hypothetical protein